VKFVTVRDLRLKPGHIWELAKRERDLIITSNGRPVAILTGVDESTVGEELDTIQRARALRALDSIHRDSVTKGTDKISEDEIQSEIDDARSGKTL